MFPRADDLSQSRQESETANPNAIVVDEVISESDEVTRHSRRAPTPNMSHTLMSCKTMADYANNNMKTVAIIGGGPAGLATAIALLRSGGDYRKVHIYESSQESQFQDETAGAALQLTSNGLQALHRLGGEGLVQQILCASSPIANNYMMNDGNLVPLPSDPPSATNKFPTTVMIRWGILRQILATNLPPPSSEASSSSCIFHWNQRVVGWEDAHDDASKTFLKLENGTVSSEPYSLVIAADGRDSKFRPTPLVKANRFNIKAVVQKQIPSTLFPPTHNHDATVALFTPTGLACFLGPAGPQGWTYWAISLPNDGTGVYNSDTSKMQQALLQLLTEQSVPDVYREMIAATPPNALLTQASTQAELPASYCISSNICLVGDSAHAMSSSYGQTASFAMEDACELAYCLLKSKNRKEEQSLQEYSQLRRERCLLMQQKSQERATRAMQGQDTSDIVSWIYDWDVSTSQDEEEDETMTVVG